jgi:hypothetical protein
MVTDCDAGGHCGLNNWKYNSLCYEDHQAISAMVNEELICGSDNDLDFEIEGESVMLCSLWQWIYLNSLYILAAENSDNGASGKG